MKAVKRLRRRATDPLVTLSCRMLVLLAGQSSAGARKACARWMSSMAWRTLSSHRRVVLANLRIAFPDLDGPAREDLGKRALLNTVLNALEFAYLAHRPELVRERVRMDERTAPMCKPGPADVPTIMVMPHLGSWELFGHAVSANGVPATSVAHRLRNASLDRYITDIRTRHGLELVHAKGAVREILKALKRGRHLGILMDQNTRPSEGGDYVTFFGLPATVTRAPALLARRLNTGVLAGACLRTEDGFQIDTEPLNKPVSDYDDEHDLLQAMMAANEALIRRHPEQYAWTYKRWRYIPPHLPDEVKARFPFYAKPCEYGETQTSTQTAAATGPAT